MKSILLFIALSIIVTTSAFAQNTGTKKKASAKKETVAQAPVGHQITVTLPDNDMQMLLGSASAGFENYIMTTQVPANQLKQAQDYYNKTVFPKALQQYNDQIKAVNDSLARIQQAKQDSIKNLANKPKQ